MINDTYGHDIGDEVIRQVGAFLGNSFINGEITGRFGGDEFIIFIKDSDNVEEAQKIAEKIVAGASENVILPDKNEKISISIGIAIYQGIENNYSELFKKADIAMYKSKADKNNRYTIYS